MVTTDLLKTARWGLTSLHPEAGAGVLNTVIFMNMKPNENWILMQMKLMGFFSRRHMLKLFKFAFNKSLQVDSGVYSIP